MEKWRTLKYVASQRFNKNLQLPTSYIGQGRIKATACPGAVPECGPASTRVSC